MAATSNPSDDHERFLPLLLFWTPRGGSLFFSITHLVMTLWRPFSNVRWTFLVMTLWWLLYGVRCIACTRTLVSWGNPFTLLFSSHPCNVMLEEAVRNRYIVVFNVMWGIVVRNRYIVASWRGTDTSCNDVVVASLWRPLYCVLWNPCIVGQPFYIAVLKALLQCDA